MNRTLVLLMIGLLSALVSCKKDEMDLASLTTNPFDPDYAGAPVFTFISAAMTSELVNGNVVNTLTIQVWVHTELFGRETTYQVSYDDGASQPIPSNLIQDRVLAIQIVGVTEGQEYCRLLRLGNGGAYGASNTICATAE